MFIIMKWIWNFKNQLYPKNNVVCVLTCSRPTLNNWNYCSIHNLQVFAKFNGLFNIYYTLETTSDMWRIRRVGINKVEEMNFGYRLYNETNVLFIKALPLQSTMKTPHYSHHAQHRKKKKKPLCFFPLLSCERSTLLLFLFNDPLLVHADLQI